MKIKRLIFSFATAVILSVGCAQVAFADSHNIAWNVTFNTSNEMVSDYDQQKANATLKDMQPGDDVAYDVTIKNESDHATDWYMTNEVLKTLEADSSAANGAYTYAITYNDNEIYSSKKVGGEGSNGLSEATNATKDGLFLATLNSGDSGKVQLKVELDGTTQGNSYMNTLGQLKINFAVEDTVTGETVTTPGEPTTTTTTTTPTDPGSSIPKTGELVMNIATALALVAGIVLIALGYRSLQNDRKRSE